MSPDKSQKCALCGRTYPRGYSFRLAPDGEGGMMSVCRVCAPRAEDLNRFEPQRREAEGADRRRYKRVQGHLLLSFRHVRGAVDRRGVVRDISQGGMRFVTEEPLSVGELLNVTVSNPLKSFTIKAVCRVKWVKEKGSRRETGIEFVARERHFDMQDRRAFPRLTMAFSVECETEGRVVHGRVKDISQGGIRFTAPEPIALGRKVLVRLEAAGCNVVSSEGGIPMEVERAAIVMGMKDGRSRYEIRARFLPPETS